MITYEMPTPEEERRQMEQAAWLIIVLFALLFVIVMVGIADKLLFDGEIFGGR